MSHTDLFADDPIDSPHDDLLDHGRFADQIVMVLDAMRKHTPSGVGVLAGPWGSGKSSVLRMLERKLSGSQDWSVGSFNPWLLSDEASLVHQFFGTLASVLPRDRGWKEARKRLASYLAVVAPLAGAIRAPLLDLEKVAAVAAKSLAGDQGLEAKRRGVETILQKLSTPVVILLDDLDRLHPDELVMVFKLVRLIGRLPNVYYLLAFDEETVVDLLEASDIGAGSKERAYTFLEKVYQVRLELPPLHQSRRFGLVDSAMNAFLERHRESFSRDDQYRFASAYHSFMSRYLRTPRQIKRYVGQVDVYYPLVKGEVDLVDFLLVTFLRATLPRLYDLLTYSKNELTLTIESAFRRDDRSMDQRKQDWESRLKGAGVAEVEVSPAMEFLGHLFLPIKSMAERMQYGNEYYTRLAEQRRVGSADFFDRYFYFGVQPDDVSDRLVDAALAELEDGGEGPAVRQVRDVSRSNGAVVFEKLLLRKDHLSGKQRAGVVHLLADIWDQLPDEMLTAPKRRAVFLGSELLLDSDPTRINANRLASGTSHLVFSTEVLSRLIRPDGEDRADQAPPWIVELAGRHTERAFEILAEATGVPLEGQEDWVIPLLFRLREVASPEQVTAWLEDRLENSSWTVEALAGALVPIATSYGGGRPIKVLAHADVLESLELLVPMPWVLQRLSGLDQGGEPIDRFTMTEEDLSFENRVRHVKAVIRQRLESGQLRAPTKENHVEPEAEAGRAGEEE